MATANNPSRRVSLSVNAPLLDSQANQAAPATAVYAFSAGGALLGQTRLDGGKGQLDIGVGADATGVRVLAGPATDEKEPQLDELLRLGAQEQHLRIERDAPTLQIELALPADIWRPWLVNRCTVKGTLQKRVVRDGVSIDFPVCRATVEIYEVDPLWVIIPKLPKHLLDKLREVIVRPIPLPDPAPDFTRAPKGPGIPQGPEPGPDPAPFARNAMVRALPANDAHRVDAEAIATLHEASGNAALRYAAMSASDLAFRQALVDNAAFVRPLLCWFYPLLVTMRRIGTAFTDDCGHFRTTIFKSIFNPDQPDLYFKARQRLFGFFDVTIYAPTPVACHTWWNYVCGSEVSLFTSHPLAITCRPCPPVIAGNNWVLFMAIGNWPLSRIHGTGQALGASTAFNLGLADGDLPWGGTLRPRLEFDNALRDTLGVRYYRLSWKRDGEVAHKPLAVAVNRHYAHVVGTDLVLDAYLLGPQTAGAESNLFEIPPAVPPLGQWSHPNVVLDTESGEFDTVAADGAPIMDGKVQLRVELFDAAGVPVDIGALGIRYFVPTSTDLASTIYTADAATLGLVVGNTMVITLHVNNEPCTAGIGAPTIGGSAADDCCGVLNYAAGSSVTLPWTASHPHGFATYSFGVVRGVSGVFSQGGAVGGGAFSTVRTVAQLLHDNPLPGCENRDCRVAGFSENLYVATSAIDGWSRLSAYDDSAVRAFVLAPA
jgi:hypothetical protein